MLGKSISLSALLSKKQKLSPVVGGIEERQDAFSSLGESLSSISHDFEAAPIKGPRPNKLRLARLVKVMWILLLLQFVRVMYLIVSEYHRYFPPDFAEGFLIEREAYFWGVYSTAFYLHIATGPIVLLIAVFLMLSGTGNKYLDRFAHWHRPLGKLQFVLVVFLLAPTGIVMSTRANTGAIAGAAFFSLSVATAFSMIAAVWHVRQRNLASHRLWATRCFLLLCSPLLLRLMQGGVITLGFDSQMTYPYSAWISWTLPLMIFEINRLFIGVDNHNTATQPIRSSSLRGD